MDTTVLVAILFTDVVGSTEIAAHLGEERAEQIRQSHFAVLREAIRAHAGTEVKNLGDGLMVAFEASRLCGSGDRCVAGCGPVGLVGVS
jgi:class 3 adenylate cyclase